jgi:hypothetical protein
MGELSGPHVKAKIPRYQKVRFVCHGCGQEAEDFAIGFPVSSCFNPKTKKRFFLVQGNLAACCVLPWLQENIHKFGEQMQDTWTLMLVEAYKVPKEALVKMGKMLPPPRWKLPQFDSTSSLPRLSGIQFHDKYKLEGLQAPDPAKFEIREARTVFLMETHRTRNGIPESLTQMKTWFPTLYFKPQNVNKDASTTGNIKAFTLFSAMNTDKIQKEQKMQNTQSNSLDSVLKPLSKTA